MNLYAVIRIPKSGSRSLGLMVEQSLPTSFHFKIPQMMSAPDGSLHPAERFRSRRRMVSGLFKYRAFNTTMLWQNISRRARDGDIISGHMHYGQPVLPDWSLSYITLLRDPIDRIVSEYHYSRKGYLSRPPWRRLYHKGHAEITGTKTFSEYVRYLCDHRSRFSNPAVKYVTGSETHTAPLSFLKSHYFHFGILERMDLFAKELADKLGAPRCEVWENKADNQQRSLPTEADLELLHTLVGRDIAFYQETREYVLSDRR